MAGCLKKLHRTPPKPRHAVQTIRESEDQRNYVPAVCAVWDAAVATADQEQRIRLLEGARK